MSTSDLEQVLRAVGLRVTAPRKAVLAQARAHPHADADTIARAVRERHGAVSTQAIYDVLHALTGAGLLRRIEPAGSPARYESRVHDNHHHLICRSCSEIIDIDCATDAVPCLEASDSRGYSIDEAEVTYWGLCPTCRPSPSP